MLEQYLNNQIYKLLFMQLSINRILSKKMPFTVNGNLLYFILEFFEVKWFAVCKVGKIITGKIIV